MQLRTYTDLWRLERRIYAIQDITLPVAIPTVQLGVCLAALVVWAPLVSALGLDGIVSSVAGTYSPGMNVILYVGPPVAVAWASGRPLAQGKTAVQLALSGLRYAAEPRWLHRLAHTRQPTQLAVRALVWRPHPPVALAMAQSAAGGDPPLSPSRASQTRPAIDGAAMNGMPAASPPHETPAGEWGLSGPGSDNGHRPDEDPEDGRQPDQAEDAIEAWRAALHERGLATRTITARCDTVARFAQWAGDSGRDVDSSQAVDEYLAELAEGYAASTVKSHRQALRQWLAWLGIDDTTTSPKSRPVEPVEDAPAPVQPRAPQGAVARAERRRRRHDRAQATSGSQRSSGAPAATEFTEQRMLRGRQDRPRKGWRRAVHAATRINLGPSRAELAERDLIRRVQTPVVGSRRIVVASRKGGVGKTTTTLNVGHTLAAWRGDRTVALDGNPDAGSLADRLRRETSETVTSLLTDAHIIERYADVRRYTSQAASRLEVVASDDDPTISQALDGTDFKEAIEVLDRFYNVLLLDTGTGIIDAANQGLMAEADQLVIVVDTALDGARTAAKTLDWLEEHGHGDLVADAVAVVNAVREKALVEVEEVEAHFAGRCRRVVRVPWDEHLDAGAVTGLDDLDDATREGYRHLAAAVAEGFADGEE